MQAKKKTYNNFSKPLKNISQLPVSYNFIKISNKNSPCSMGVKRQVVHNWTPRWINTAAPYIDRKICKMTK